MMLSYETLNIFGIVLLVFGVWFYLKKNDEIPIILALFNYSISISRFDLIQAGKISYVQVNYTFNIFNLNDAKAIEAMNYILLGTLVLIFGYSLFSSKYSKEKQLIIEDQHLLSIFLTKNKIKILVGFLLFFAINSAMRGMISGSLALGNSYFFLFGMGIGGFNLLIALLILTGNLTSFQKFFFGACLVFGIMASYNPTTRFVFLSWAIGISFLVFGDMPPSKKLKYILPIGVGVIIFFSLLGVVREPDARSLNWEEKLELAMERTLTNEDQNMLDGFMMVLDVYPDYLDFSMGMEHIEILLRPIPRSLWPGKPLGGYANKLGLNDVESGTIGISQTLYGSFFGEGGAIGIIVFSVIYAKLLAWLLSLSNMYNSRLSYLIKGVIVASLIPLLRGGDLPGIYAFIGMSFWPVFIFIYYYNRFVKRSILSVNGGYNVEL